MDEYISKAAPAGVFRADGWSNVLTGLGVEGLDRRLASTASIEFLTQWEADALYHSDDMMARVVDLVPDEMTRAGIELTQDPDGKLREPLEALGAMEKLNEAMKWSRQSGAGYVFLGAFDGKKVNQPLDENNIKRFDHLTVFDRFEVTVDALYTDPLSPKFGEPKFYKINPSITSPTGDVSQQQIHESRFIRFDGVLTKRSVKQMNEYVSVSVLERCRDVIRDFVMGHHAAAVIVQDFGQRTYGINGLAQMLASDQDGLLIKRLKLLDRTRSIFRAVLVDAEKESLEVKSPAVSGLDDLLYQLGIRLSACTGIPLTLLLGESPGGMNATGESDHRNFYNVVAAMQERVLRPALARILRLLVRTGNKRKLTDSSGAVPFVFKPLWQPSELDIAKARWDMAQADNVYLTTGALSPDEVRKRFAGAHFSSDLTVPAGSKAPGPPAPPPGAKAPSSGTSGG